MGKGKAVVILSGGQDSTVCLFDALTKYDEVVTLTFDYGQLHRIEIESAQKISKMAGVLSYVLGCKNILGGDSPLTNPTKNVGTYSDSDSLPGGLEDTFVPARNLLFLSMATNFAYINECDYIVTGVSQEDFGGYPDCRQSFISSMQNTIQLATDKDIKIVTPLIDLDKESTVLLGNSLDGCNEAMAYSHTCYKGGVGDNHAPCGECHSCLLREKGFREANTDDPLILRLRGLRGE